ncbi:LOB domain-containing protein 7-like [Hibiscus syriacus]|uniref:LOB domain-containing protein 7-like n=1 Tax=Hibiscus syriacus TaxID=106335 RepID=UPI0019231FAC|nr:LOB domain-containing protein 7-like [Hibiscus syriacus]
MCRLFGVRNIMKLIENISFRQRVIALKIIVFQSNMRVFDPVGGCCKYILDLNMQIARYRAELDLVNQQLTVCKAPSSMFAQPQPVQKQKQVVAVENGGFYVFGSISAMGRVLRNESAPEEIHPSQGSEARNERH